MRRGRPWSLPPADRVLPVAAYWRTNLTMRQLALLFGVSKSAAGLIVGQPVPGNRNDCKAWAESRAEAAVGKTTTIADGGYPGTGLIMPTDGARTNT